MSFRAFTTAAAIAALVSTPLHAQRSRRSSAGTHRGIPCGRSYISANKVCHIATSTADTSADSAAHVLVRSPLPAAVLPAGSPAVTPSGASATADLEAIRRERDSLRIVVATLKQVCTGKP